MNISIIGLGYVGVITGVCLSSLGHKVFGCDLSKEKVKMLSNGVMPFLEYGCEELLKKSILNKTFSASTSLKDMLDESDLTFVCVGTPSLNNGEVDLSSIKKVLKDINEYLKNRDRWLGICIRSTIPPGTINNTVIPIFNVENYLNNKYSIAFCPEFLREGNSVNDFFKPPLTVTASSDNKIKMLLNELWSSIPGKFQGNEVSFEEAELYKYTSNAFHALKISFANEISLISKEYNANPNVVMDLLKSDTLLNISTKYLRPGYAFGGSCLPKDLRALSHLAKKNNLVIPVLSNILKSNENIILNAKNHIIKNSYGAIGFAGITFKDGTDDLRESSVLKLIYDLSKKYDKISVHDENIDINNLTGVNLKIWQKFIELIEPVVYEKAEDFIKSVDTIIIHGLQENVFKEIRKSNLKKNVIDLNEI
ncbi:MAG: GDP-mannose dehydrogenase [Candidatus Marinimicrobia bacterium]|nr:GDP-mannose dehydrogenase [Candidatus Neomarinimicrobiota bacterium]|tara:strand:+ start:75 stop:1343 length:1269 start_codon:yes stop_codon:yes gene_type:complete